MSAAELDESADVLDPLLEELELELGLLLRGTAGSGSGSERGRGSAAIVMTNTLDAVPP